MFKKDDFLPFVHLQGKELQVRKDCEDLLAAIRKLAGLLWEVVFYYFWIVPGFHRRKYKLNNPELLAQYSVLLTSLRNGEIARPDQKVADILMALYGRRLTLGALGTTVAELRTFAPDYVDREVGNPRLKDG